MRVLITGSHGLIGSALVEALEADGDEVRRLPRSANQWDPEKGVVDDAVLDGVDAVVHLAGEGIGEHRWNDEHKRKVLDSRVKGTTALATAIARRPDQIRCFVSGSAIGYYGDGGDTPLTEDAPPGAGYLADVARQWEAAASPAEQAGVRTVRLRTGIVLAGHGGALKKMLPPFRVGAGGWMGDGRQWMSWISLADEVGAIRTCIDTELEGPVNSVAPNPATSKEFSKAIGRVLRRPVLVGVPPFAIRTMLGKQMADEMLLAGQRVVPAKLESVGYRYKHPRLDEALAAALHKDKD